MRLEPVRKDDAHYSNSESNRITKECLQIALMKLMGEKEFGRITITEITRCAGVSRTAFYRNYDSKEAIIEDACRSIFVKLSESIGRSRNDWKGWYRMFFETLAANAESVRIALEAGIEVAPRNVLDNVFPPSTKQDHYINSAKEAAFERIMTEWFRGGMKESPEEMSVVCDRIMRGFNEGSKE